jgi:hypothetical protein
VPKGSFFLAFRRLAGGVRQCALICSGSSRGNEAHFSGTAQPRYVGYHGIPGMLEGI